MPPGHSSVNLGGAQFNVSQEFLDRTQISTPLQQVGGERVTQGVREGSQPAPDRATHPSGVERTAPDPNPQRRDHPRFGQRRAAAVQNKLNSYCCYTFLSESMAAQVVADSCYILAILPTFYPSTRAAASLAFGVLRWG